jgi:hypothetical protein
VEFTPEFLYYSEFWAWIAQRFETTIEAAAFLKPLCPDRSFDAIRDLANRARSGRTPSRPPRDWAWKWPMPSYPGHPNISGLPHANLTPRAKKRRAGAIVNPPEVKSPSDTFELPQDTPMPNVVTDATGGKLGDEIATRFLEPIFDNPREVPTDFDSLVGSFERAQQEKKLHDRSQRLARIDLRAVDVPILIMQHTDVHWGSEDTDYDAIRRHIRLLRESPFTYAFGTGDFQEFAKLKHRGAVDGQIHVPTVQARGVRAAILETWDKWLAMVLGNHDMRVWLESGFDIGEYLIGEVPPGKRKIPFLRDGGFVYLELGSQIYTHNVFHGDSSFGTRFNENHKARQTARLVDGRFDCTWNGHTHNPAIQDTNEPSDDGQGTRDAAYLQGGSYKVKGDDHAVRRKYMCVRDVQMPAVIQFPDYHLTLPFKRVEIASFVHKQLVAAYQQGATIRDVMPLIADVQ